MKIEDITKILNALASLKDFVDENTDGDESGIREEMNDEISECRDILRKERHRITKTVKGK